MQVIKFILKYSIHIQACFCVFTIVFNINLLKIYRILCHFILSKKILLARKFQEKLLDFVIIKKYKEIWENLGKYNKLPSFADMPQKYLKIPKIFKKSETS